MRLRCLAAMWAVLLGACTQEVLLLDLTDARASDAIHHGPFDGGDRNGQALDACPARTDRIGNYNNTAEVMIALDRSSAMNLPLGASGLPTRYAATMKLLGMISKYQSSIEFGLIEYPGPSSTNQCNDFTCCASNILVPRNRLSLDNIQKWMVCESPNSCPNPTTDAPIHLVLGRLANENVWSLENNPKVILLLTASEPGCAGRGDVCDKAIQSAKRLADMNISVVPFAIGWSPTPDSCITLITQSSLPSPLLPNNKPVSIQTESDLTKKLEELLLPLYKRYCEVTLRENVANTSALTVALDTEKVPMDPANGWTYTPSNPGRIVLNGKWCENYRTAKLDRLTITETYSDCGGGPRNRNSQ